MKHNYSTYSNEKCRCEVCTKAWRDYCRERNYAAGRRRPAQIFAFERRIAADERPGIQSRYKEGCRCEECKAFSRENRRYHRQQAASKIATRTDIPHGRLSTYDNHGCRCEACLAAKRAYDRSRRAKAGFTMTLAKDLLVKDVRDAADMASKLSEEAGRYGLTEQGSITTLRTAVETLADAVRTLAYLLERQP